LIHALENGTTLEEHLAAMDLRRAWKSAPAGRLPGPPLPVHTP
jgi:hypothetical protein